jgi:hypothetical protein
MPAEFDGFGLPPPSPPLPIFSIFVFFADPRPPPPPPPPPYLSFNLHQLFSLVRRCLKTQTTQSEFERPNPPYPPRATAGLFVISLGILFPILKFVLQNKKVPRSIGSFSHISSLTPLPPPICPFLQSVSSEFFGFTKGSPPSAPILHLHLHLTPPPPPPTRRCSSRRRVTRIEHSELRLPALGHASPAPCSRPSPTLCSCPCVRSKWRVFENTGFQQRRRQQQQRRRQQRRPAIYPRKCLLHSFGSRARRRHQSSRGAAAGRCVAFIPRSWRAFCSLFSNSFILPTFIHAYKHSFPCSNVPPYALTVLLHF